MLLLILGDEVMKEWFKKHFVFVFVFMPIVLGVAFYVEKSEMIESLCSKCIFYVFIGILIAIIATCGMRKEQWEEKWEKIQSLNKKHPKLFPWGVFFGGFFVILILSDLYIFYDEICKALTWIFSTDNKILLLSVTGLIGLAFWVVMSLIFPSLKLSSVTIFIMLAIILIILAISLIIVMFDMTLSPKICKLLDTSSKHETIKFIALGMGGVIAAIVAAAVNRRASAQEETNKLAKKSRIDERFNFAAQNVGSTHARTRIAAYNQFYYLAISSHLGKNDKDFRESIFKILCSCFRPMPHHLLLHSDKPETECEKECEKRSEPYKKQYIKQCVEKLKWAREEYKMLFYFLFESIKSDNKDSKLTFYQFFFDFRETNLKKATFSGVILSGANFKRATLSKADLSKAHLSGANLSEAKFSYANLSEADFSGTEYWNEEKWRKETEALTDEGLKNVKKMGANLEKANLSGANLSKADLSYANLSEVNFSGKKPWDEKCWHEKISGLTNEKPDDAEEDDVKEIGANLEKATLSNAILSNTDLSNANLQKAQLENVDFNSVRSLEGTDFRGAKIGTRLITEGDLPRDKGTYILNTPEEES